ncbi:MAG: AAC(3) family N-acetyltransferase [Verrucomicrobiae bacterium]|nr:AAC(3) family N-acetyltransferase [Verrucomicrobiae bacterium]
MHKKILSLVNGELNMENLMDVSLGVYRHERQGGYRQYEQSAAFFQRQLAAAGASGVKSQAIPADGKSTFLDYTIPQAWDIRSASLEIVSPIVAEKRLASMQDEILCVANRCGPTPKEGVLAEVVTVEQMANMERLDGKMVFTQEIHPSKIRREIVRKNGAGIISGYSAGPLDIPDGTYWINGWGFPGWYQTREDRQMVCFSITPRKSALLADLLRKGSVKVRAKADSRFYDGSIHSVTGVVPGKKKEEILLYAHIYEPFLPDDAIGAGALVEISRLLNALVKDGKLPPLQRGVRLLVSQERYGFAHYFRTEQASRGILCGVSMDSICHDYHRIGLPIRIRMSPASQPYFGDFLFRDIMNDVLADYPRELEPGNLDNDTFLSDQTIGIPTNWAWTHPGKYHHNSVDQFDRMTDWRLGRRIVAGVAAYAAALATADGDRIEDLRQKTLWAAKGEMVNEAAKLNGMIRDGSISPSDALDRLEFAGQWQKGRVASLARIGVKDGQGQREIDKALGEARKNLAVPKKVPAPVLSRREKLAQNRVVTRKGRIVPFCLTRVPCEKRMELPCALGQVFNWLDGKRDFYEVLRLCGFERGNPLSEKEISHWLRFLDLLSQYGYVSIRYKRLIGKKDIQEGLKRLGVRKGDKVMVHCSFSSIGQVDGGPRTVCEAIMDLVSPQGLVMMPSFNHYGIIESDGAGYYDPLKTPTKNGVVADTFWRMKNVCRSLDPSHPFATWGANALDYVKNHHKVVTMGVNSPLHLLEQAEGKVILFDCPMSNTFMHVVEMTSHVPCLGDRTEEYPVKLPGGRMVSCRTWGWRDGGCPVVEKGRPYEWMRKKGLLKEGKVGEAPVMVLKLKDYRRALEPYFKGEIPGFSCKTCKTRIRKVAGTRPSDWDAKSQRVRPDTKAFVDDIDWKA